MAIKSSTANSPPNSDHVHVIQSSIVLLQERFKQLQREKELREKRDLLRLFSAPIDHHHHHQQQIHHDHVHGGCRITNIVHHHQASNSTCTTTTCTAAKTTTTSTVPMQYDFEPSKLFFHPDLFLPAAVIAPPTDPSSYNNNNSNRPSVPQSVSLALWPTSQTSTTMTKQQQHLQPVHVQQVQQQTSSHEVLLGMERSSTAPPFVQASRSSYFNYNYDKFDDRSVCDVDTSLHL